MTVQCTYLFIVYMAVVVLYAQIIIVDGGPLTAAANHRAVFDKY